MSTEIAKAQKYRDRRWANLRETLIDKLLADCQVAPLDVNREKGNPAESPECAELFNRCLGELEQELFPVLERLAKHEHSRRAIVDNVHKNCIRLTVKSEGGEPGLMNPTKATSFGIRPRLLLDDSAKRVELQGDRFNVYLGHLVWLLSYRFLRGLGYHREGEYLLIEWWNEYSKIQLGSDAHIYRAAAAYYLAEHCYDEGEIAAAARWAMLAFIDDELNTVGSPDTDRSTKALTGARWILEHRFGIPYAPYAALIADHRKGKFPHLELFPEYYFVKLLLQKVFAPTHQWLESTRASHPICVPVLRAFDSALEASEQSKGHLYEEKISYLFGTIDGFLPMKNFTPSDKCFEADVLVLNCSRAALSMTAILGDRLLVECKNRNSRFEAHEVGAFASKLRVTGAKVGFVFSRTGLTGWKADEVWEGRDTKKYAVGMVRRLSGDVRVVPICDPFESDATDDNPITERIERGETFLQVLMRAYLDWL